jgi:hypothetical protein
MSVMSNESAKTKVRTKRNSHAVAQNNVSKFPTELRHSRTRNLIISYSVFFIIFHLRVLNNNE